jgi:hypothetical protein
VEVVVFGRNFVVEVGVVVGSGGLVGLGVAGMFERLRDDLRAPLAGWAEDPMKTNQRVSWGRDERAEACDRLMGIHDAVGSSANGVLELVDDLAVFGDGKALKAQRRAGTVADLMKILPTAESASGFLARRSLCSNGTESTHWRKCQSPA